MLLSLLTAVLLQLADPAAVVVPGLKSDQLETGHLALLNEVLLTELQKLEPGVRVFGPSDLNDMIGFEKLKDAAGCDDVSCVRDLAGALGAKRIVVGRIGALGDRMAVTLKLIHIDEARVAQRSQGSYALAQPNEFALLAQRLLVDLGFGKRGPAATANKGPLTPPPPRPPPTLATARMQVEEKPYVLPWVIMGASVLLVIASVVVDTVPASADNGRFDALDVVPIAGYTVGAAGVIWAWQLWASQ
jgi:hypothetical protein